MFCRSMSVIAVCQQPTSMHRCSIVAYRSTIEGPRQANELTSDVGPVMIVYYIYVVMLYCSTWNNPVDLHVTWSSLLLLPLHKYYSLEYSSRNLQSFQSDQEKIFLYLPFMPSEKNETCSNTKKNKNRRLRPLLPLHS